MLLDSDVNSWLTYVGQLMSDKRRHHPTTRLRSFLASEGISPSRLARLSHYSRQHIYLVRTGQKQPSREFMRAVLHAASRITGKHYQIDQLFEMDARPRVGRKTA